MADKRYKRSYVQHHWTLAQRLEHYTDKSGGPDACWPWTGGFDSKGYGQLFWNGKMRLAHRLAWEQEIGPIPEGLEVCHGCDNPPCRNESHLFLDTHAGNMADMKAKGRGRGGGVKGEAIWCAKLTEADVRAIRSASGSQRAIAALFGVDQSSVSLIRRGITWAHVL